jgi:hypothetical protein
MGTRGETHDSRQAASTIRRSEDRSPKVSSRPDSASWTTLAHGLLQRQRGTAARFTPYVNPQESDLPSCTVRECKYAARGSVSPAGPRARYDPYSISSGEKNHLGYPLRGVLVDGSTSLSPVEGGVLHPAFRSVSPVRRRDKVRGSGQMVLPAPRGVR